MRRLASALLAVSMAGGCVSNSANTDLRGNATSWDRNTIRSVPGVTGPYGERIPVTAGMTPKSPSKSWATPGMASASSPVDKQITQASATMPMPADGSGVQQAVNFGPLSPGNHHARPISGPFGGGGPGDGMLASNQPLPRFPAQRTQIRFVRPSGMKVAWFTQGADGRAAYSASPIEAPGRYNFPQGAIYRLKLSNIEGRPGLEVYPTVEVFPTTPKSESFLQHCPVPVEFTPDDFKQIAAGSYVVKVIYLPDPEFQDAASTGTEEILSTKLEPGVDPIQEAIRRGTILLVVRMGNIDQEAPNTPPLNAATIGGGRPNPILNFGPTVSPQAPGHQVPFGPTGGGMPSGPSGALPPQVQGIPSPLPQTIVESKTTAPVVNGIPVSRPGMATAIPPAPPAPVALPTAPLLTPPGGPELK